MNILFAGDWVYDIYEPALSRGFEKAGAAVTPFSYADYFPSPMLRPGTLLQYVQARFQAGPRVRALNEGLRAAAGGGRYDVILIRRGYLIWPETVRALREAAPGALIASYNNDNAFEDGEPWLWRHHRRSLPFFDAVFVTQRRQIEPAKQHGARAVYLSRSYYREGVDRPVEADDPQYRHDVVFIGHYEDDGRLACLEALKRAGFDVAIYGDRHSWRRARTKLFDTAQIRPVYHEDYAKVLSSAKIALAFFSHRNKDAYTRRVFEIPACGAFMAAPRTPDMEALYEDRKEAALFGSKEELVELVRHYLPDDTAREAIAAAGHRRCLASGYSNIARAKEMLDILKNHLNAGDRSPAAGGQPADASPSTTAAAHISATDREKV